MDYLDLTCTDPSRNLAMEQHVFDALPRDRAYFMLWQNDNAIIIGKHQNTLAEINEPYVRAHGIRVVRRLSGGGAVYHDLGNLNFTFITDAGDTAKLDFRLFCLPIVRTLEGFGVHAEVNGRNDITIDGKKFSGNSQYLRQGRVMHHGTILFDSDLSVVADALRVDESKLRAKGVRSVRSRVTNVRPYLPDGVTLAEFRAALLQNILRETPGSAYVPTPADEAAVDALCAERYGTYDWNYGASPECTLLRRARIEGCGTVEAYLTIERGVIVRLAFRGDFFSIDEPETLADRFLGLRLEPEQLRSALREVDVSRCFVGMTDEAFLSLLIGESEEA
ncbi:MAG: lipoate--protein ligase [Ruminococcaceae bacterium]|nr:lipoate--protein ligase [Oscillospiraceae bacterium]